MRHGKRALALILIAVLMLAILPATAHADPPQNDPTHKHNWKVTSYTKPTCEKDGKKTWKCSACGKTYTETYKALGHDWDEGVITTEPFFFNPGVRTYTCKRDSSHTYTEEIDPTDWIFAALHGSSKPRPFLDPSTLVITEQPVGGAITRCNDETHTMYVTVEGGEPPYTYEWHAGYQETLKEESANQLAKWLLGLLGVSAEEVDAALNASLCNEAEFTVSSGNEEYWCVVTDRNGDDVTSDRAKVRYKLRITDEPDDTNLQPTGKAVLTCAAADGLGADKYEYRWYTDDLVFRGKGPTCEAEEEGVYFCEVTDGVDTIESQYATVYSGPPLKIYAYSPFETHWQGEESEIFVYVEGGEPPYEVWVEHNGEAMDAVEGKKDESGWQRFSATTVEAGEYIFHVVDSWYANTTRTILRFEKHLDIKKQPEGGSFPEGGQTNIAVTVSGGDAPYTYILYRNGKEYRRETYDRDSCSYRIYYAGEYSFRVEDSSGHYVDSDSVAFDNEVFRIVSQTDQATITTPYTSAVLKVEAADGAEPYTYDWAFYAYNETEKEYNWYTVGDNRPTCTAYEPGWYRCHVSDKDGNHVWSRKIRVVYDNEAPLIIKQPKNRTAKRFDDGTFAFTMKCEAVCGQTGGCPRYEWYWRAWEGDGQWYYMLCTYNKEYNATRPGMYQCKVIDDSTGKYTWSQVATVAEKLVIKKAEAWTSANSIRYVYRFSFTGGVGPYKIKYFPAYADTGKKINTTAWKTEEVLNMKDLEEIRILLPKTLWLKYEGEPEEEVVVAWYVVITDAFGQKQETDILKWN